MKVKVTMEFTLDEPDIDSRGDEEWAVFHVIQHHCATAGNADDFYGHPLVKVDYTTDEPVGTD